ncbi:hypothetical protein [Myroides guanonis]|uniref:Carboxypeptidase regulatory-like domain-containing protein n=1 Tax=Myroides guanonis TaxID=1150112 RepID=A0A1I3MEV3_9FLAO|nr:hypothetical protein [Myroides guanonis]SFI95320.1 hypothetical protein SAMN04487893_102131 [Myroides guanonis]
MKKLFMFLAVAGLATFGASCSSDDGGGTPPKTSQLLAKASPSTVEVNKAVTFSATSDGKAVDGVKFYDGSTELKNPHTFTAKGEYKIVAKKQGFTDSPAITVTVKDVVVPGEQTLMLTVLPSEVTLGSAVTFVVKEGSADVSTSAEIFVNNQKITGTSYTATAVGTYKVIAKKAGAIDSAEKTFTVVEGGVEPEGSFIEIGGEYYDVASARLSANAASDGKGGWTVYVYTNEDGEKYSVFAMDLAKINAAGTEYVARSLVTVVVFQDPAKPGILLPGQGAFQFVGGMATDFTTTVQFAFDDIKNFTFTTPGANGVVELAASNAEGSIKHNGAYEGIGVLPVDANGDPLQSKSAFGVSKAVTKSNLQARF